jgi:hypothetical protein
MFSDPFRLEFSGLKELMEQYMSEAGYERLLDT